MLCNKECHTLRVYNEVLNLIKDTPNGVSHLECYPTHGVRLIKVTP